MIEKLDQYARQVAYSVEDEGFIATVPELPGCSAFGATADEALAELKSAIESWIAAMQAAGNPVPAPVSLDTSQPSGKFVVRMAKSLHAQIAQAAQQEGVSLNQYVVTTLAAFTLKDVVHMQAASAGRKVDDIFKNLLDRQAQSAARQLTESTETVVRQFQLATDAFRSSSSAAYATGGGIVYTGVSTGMSLETTHGILGNVQRTANTAGSTGLVIQELQRKKQVHAGG